MTYTVTVSMTIKPLSSLPDSYVRDFLTRHQHESAVIDWKYYDREFNTTGERGFACVRDDRIVAFLGLIPFTVMHNGTPAAAAWSCDWYKDPDVSGPLGIMLIRQSLTAYPFIYSLGGSEMTKAIMGRLARVTIPTAGLELYRPLRMGGALQMLQKATGIRHLSSIPLLNNVGLPVGGWTTKKSDTQLLNRLPAVVGNLLEESARNGHEAAYDLPYLQWLLERCPAITGGLCLVSDGGKPSGAVLFWCQAGDPRLWRICLVPGRATYASLGLGLRAALLHIRRNGGWLAALLLSRLDHEGLKLARRYGFYRSNARRPLYILTREADRTPEELARLTYLDTDYAYRFPVMP